MKTIRTDPGAKRLMESLRNMGYDCSTAIADLVDNSIAAGASEIYIDIIPKQETRQDTMPKKEYHPAAIVIADNGKGMNQEELHEAMRYGTLQDYSLRDLGKYGLGLKTASLSQCRILTVSSKAKSGEGNRPRRHIMRWDIDHVYETNEWDILIPEENELGPWEEKLLDQEVAKDSGTVVLWTNLEGSVALLSSNNIRERERILAHLIEDISGYLRMVFHRFMQGSVRGRRKLNIYLCGELLTPWDPFCRNEKTQELDILRLGLISIEADGSKLEETVTVSPFILPHQDEFSSQDAWKEASGPRNWNQQQGFYFYRNDRLLQAGGWSHLRTSDEHTKLLRVAVDFSGELDRAFEINITKMRAKIPVELREKIETSVSNWAKLARARYDAISGERKESVTNINIPPVKVSTGIEDILPTAGDNIADSDFKILDEFKTNGEKWTLQKFCELILDLLEAVSKGRVSPKHIPLRDIKEIYHSLWQ